MAFIHVFVRGCGQQISRVLAWRAEVRNQEGRGEWFCDDRLAA
jgi:hypothetical protein